MDELHYNDGYIDYRIIPAAREGCFCDPLIVMANPEGKAKVISSSDNFFTEQDIVDAYVELFDAYEENDPETKKEKVTAFKQYLTKCGADLED